jgi:hypothetical protein
MQKIKSITLRNFKYFFGKETEQPQNTAKVDLGTTVKLGQGYGNIRYGLKIKTDAGDNIKDLKEIIFKDGQKLIDKLNA